VLGPLRLLDHDLGQIGRRQGAAGLHGLDRGCYQRLYAILNHLNTWLLACGSKVLFHSLLPVVRPAGRTTGNKNGIYRSAEG
jgi:hypothetical protein